MLQPFNRAVMTNAGANLLTRAQAGEITIQFTRVVTGDGIYNPEEKYISALQELTELKSQKNSYPISRISVFTKNSVKITAYITNQDPVTGEALVSTGYHINEMGLFAKEKDGDSSTEVLYSVTTIAGDKGDFMPPYNGYNPAQIIQDYIVTVNNTTDVTIQTGIGAVALAEDLESLRNIVAESNKAIQEMEKSVDETLPLLKAENPTSETNGKLKQFCVNTETGELFICTGGEEGYNWVRTGGADLSLYDSFLNHFVVAEKLISSEVVLNNFKPSTSNRGFFSIKINKIYSLFTGEKVDYYKYNDSLSWNAFIMRWEIIPVLETVSGNLHVEGMTIDSSFFPNAKVFLSQNNFVFQSFSTSDTKNPIVEWGRSFHKGEFTASTGESTIITSMKGRYKAFLFRFYMFNLTNTIADLNKLKKDDIQDKFTY